MTWVYLCENPLKVPDGILDEYVKRMDDKRREKANRYYFQKDRAMCILAWGLLEKGIKEIFDFDSLPEINWENKPGFVNHPDIFFNLSHCNEVVACAISSHEIGVDVQNSDDMLIEAGGHILPEKQVERLNKIENSDRKIIEYRREWARKEAYGKYMGVGLVYETKTQGFTKDLSIYEKNTEKYSLCVVGKWKNIEIKKVEFGD